METALIAKLEQIVSAPRLQRYRIAASTDFDAVVLYCWNIQLAEAMLPSLAIFEVAFRNAVHTTLTAHANTEFWFKPVLHQRMYDNVLQQILKLTQRQGIPPTAGKVISELTFGFWPHMFAKQYNSLRWRSSHPLLGGVIPNHPRIARETRAKFEERLEYFATLRNRVMHQEAVFEGVAALNRPILQIETVHSQLVETIGWINVDAVILATCLDKFNDTFHNGTERVELALRHHFKH